MLWAWRRIWKWTTPACASMTSGEQLPPGQVQRADGRDGVRPDGPPERAGGQEHDHGEQADGADCGRGAGRRRGGRRPDRRRALRPQAGRPAQPQGGGQEQADDTGPADGAVRAQ